MYPSLVLVQPRKTRPCLTERLLMGRKESNQTIKQTNSRKSKSLYETSHTSHIMKNLLLTVLRFLISAGFLFDSILAIQLC